MSPTRADRPARSPSAQASSRPASRVRRVTCPAKLPPSPRRASPRACRPVPPGSVPERDFRPIPPSARVASAAKPEIVSAPAMMLGTVTPTSIGGSGMRPPVPPPRAASQPDRTVPRGTNGDGCPMTTGPVNGRSRSICLASSASRRRGAVPSSICPLPVNFTGASSPPASSSTDSSVPERPVSLRPLPKDHGRPENPSRSGHRTRPLADTRPSSMGWPSTTVKRASMSARWRPASPTRPILTRVPSGSGVPVVSRTSTGWSPKTARPLARHGPASAPASASMSRPLNASVRRLEGSSSAAEPPVITRRSTITREAASRPAIASESPWMLPSGLRVPSSLGPSSVASITRMSPRRSGITAISNRARPTVRTGPPPGIPVAAAATLRRGVGRSFRSMGPSIVTGMPAACPMRSSKVPR